MDFLVPRFSSYSLFATFSSLIFTTRRKRRRKDSHEWEIHQNLLWEKKTTWLERRRSFTLHRFFLQVFRSNCSSSKLFFVYIFSLGMLALWHCSRMQTSQFIKWSLQHFASQKLSVSFIDRHTTSFTACFPFFLFQWREQNLYWYHRQFVVWVIIHFSLLWLNWLNDFLSSTLYPSFTMSLSRRCVSFLWTCYACRRFT